MAWEHRIAKELKKRDNRDSPTWFTGQVLSPVKETDKDGNATYSGETIVSCYDGAVVLKSDRLQQLTGGARVYAGQTVAMVGNLFGGGPGSQSVLILGAVENAV